MSTHVAALERALGGTLVDRRHRPVRPTELGAAFLPHARAVLAALEAHRELIAGETLSAELELVDSGAEDTRQDPADDAMKAVAVTVEKVGA